MSAGLAVEGVLVGEALEFALALKVALDEVHAVVVVDGDVHDGDATVDALRVQRALPGGDAVAAQLDDAAVGGHDGCSLSVGRCAQRALAGDVRICVALQ